MSVDREIVYFIGHDNTGEIKIGITTSIQKRMKSLQSNNGRYEPHTFLAGVRGDRVHERQLHKHFTHLRTQGEYFRPDYQLEDYVRWIRAQGFAMRKVEDEPVNVEFDAWAPNDERTLSPCQLKLTANGTWDRILEDLPLTGDDYYTNERIITAARNVCGHFDLDPASHPVANDRFIQAKRIFTIYDNGLTHAWFGNVWCNPPFNKWDLWTPKIVGEWQNGNIQQMFVLMASRSSTAKSNRALWQTSFAICMTDGRIPFWGPFATSSPDDGHIIAYFGQHVSSFVSNFEEIGSTFVNPHRPVNLD